jgi:site-specific DNA-cytosine methylase
MKILSLFDGISAGQVALQKAGIQVDTYYASEIDKYAIKVTQENFPNTIQLGSITEWRTWDIDWSSIDLVFGGSPCQGFSIAGKQLNFDDERSKLFFTFVDIVNHIKSLKSNVFFMLENVGMKKEYEDVITEFMGVNPIKINSSLVSAQNRKRLYWTNIPNVAQPEDKGILLKDILMDDSTIDDKYKLSDIGFDYMSRLRNGRPRWKYHTNYLDGKAACLTANMYKGVPYGIIMEKKRRLTVEECEILQTFPINYTSCVSNTQRYKALGNSWTVDVIAHIFKNILTK